jgi:hypothetical protein
VQRALAAKVQDLSGTFRRKQRLYMESAWWFLILLIGVFDVLACWGRIARTCGEESGFFDGQSEGAGGHVCT